MNTKSYYSKTVYILVEQEHSHKIDIFTMLISYKDVKKEDHCESGYERKGGTKQGYFQCGKHYCLCAAC